MVGEENDNKSKNSEAGLYLPHDRIIRNGRRGK